MTELVNAIASWHSLLLLVVVFGIAPGFVLRLLVKVYPRDDPRRRELVNQLYNLGRIERLLFVGEQIETVLFEGLPHRMRAFRRHSTPKEPIRGGIHDGYLDLLDRVISKIETIERELPTGKALPYRRTRPVLDSGTSSSTYSFELDCPSPPIYGALVELDGSPGALGTVQRSTGSELIVTFGDRIDITQIPRQGGLCQLSNVTLAARRRYAVSQLREGKAANPHLLAILASGDFCSSATHGGRAWLPDSPLNESQFQALHAAHTAPDLLLIKAPPGTGKTRVITEIIRQCVANGERVLVVSATRHGRDSILERMPGDANAFCILSGGEVSRSLHGDAQGSATDCIGSTHVVVGTCLSATLSGSIAGLEFDVLIVDEAARVGLLDILPLLVNAKRTILLGDHRQLPPFVDSVVREWLEQLTGSQQDTLPVNDIRALVTVSVFELLLESAPSSRIVSLFTQRRMPPAVAEFVSKHFYDSQLASAVWQDDSELPARRLLASPFTIVDTSDMQRSERLERVVGSSFVNHLEAELISGLVADKAYRDYDCAVIVPYRAQARLINDRLAARSRNGVDVSTIDSFIGRESEVVIVGLTRSNDSGNVGFLTELRRLNVAMTRARMQLVIVGDWKTLSIARAPQVKALMADMLMHAQRRGEVLTARELQDRMRRGSGGPTEL